MLDVEWTAINIKHRSDERQSDCLQHFHSIFLKVNFYPRHHNHHKNGDYPAVNVNRMRAFEWPLPCHAIVNWKTFSLYKHNYVNVIVRWTVPWSFHSEHRLIMKCLVDRLPREDVSTLRRRLNVAGKGNGKTFSASDGKTPDSKSVQH